MSKFDFHGIITLNWNKRKIFVILVCKYYEIRLNVDKININLARKNWDD